MLSISITRVCAINWVLVLLQLPDGQYNLPSMACDRLFFSQCPAITDRLASVNDCLPFTVMSAGNMNLYIATLVWVLCA